MKTIEDKAKAYDEALERAKEKYPTCYSPTLLDYIFPELKENKDIEIRKDIISNLKRYINCIKDGYDTHSAKNFVVNEIEKQIVWLEKQGEQNPTDRVEPKFHKGDWIVSPDNLVCKITHANSHSYTLHLYNNDYRIFETESWYIDKKYHLWTIDDARDGDVLATDKSVFIYAKVLYNKPYAYCGVDKFGVFKDNCLKYDWANSVDNIHPATKEQCDLLFQKMKETGYIFDFEKKELKKIENEIEIPFGAKDSELQQATYYIPKGFYAEIKDDKVVIKKGEKPTSWSEDDERIKKRLINLVNEVYDNTNYITFLEHKELLAWLEKLDDNVEL